MAGLDLLNGLRIGEGTLEMAILNLPDSGEVIEDFITIKTYLDARGIQLDQWQASTEFSADASQEEILAAYQHEIDPYMKEHGFVKADIIAVNSETPNIESIRQKFLPEHTHSEAEARYFIEGEGQFFFHLEDGDNEQVLLLHCFKGDFLSVPAGAKHWFDMAPAYNVKCIRIFSTEEGWVANYTGSEIDKKYNK